GPGTAVYYSGNADDIKAGFFADHDREEICMKKKAKRIVSAICALAMCAAMLPVQAFATDGAADAAGSSAGSTVVETVEPTQSGSTSTTEEVTSSASDSTSTTEE